MGARMLFSCDKCWTMEDSSGQRGALVIEDEHAHIRFGLPRGWASVALSFNPDRQDDTLRWTLCPGCADAVRGLVMGSSGPGATP